MTSPPTSVPSLAVIRVASAGTSREAGPFCAAQLAVIEDVAIAQAGGYLCFSPVERFREFAHGAEFNCFAADDVRPVRDHG